MAEQVWCFPSLVITSSSVCSSPVSDVATNILCPLVPLDWVFFRPPVPEVG